MSGTVTIGAIRVDNEKQFTEISDQLVALSERVAKIEASMSASTLANTLAVCPTSYKKILANPNGNKDAGLLKD